jgi:hypothetical protein
MLVVVEQGDQITLLQQHQELVEQVEVEQVVLQLYHVLEIQEQLTQAVVAVVEEEHQVGDLEVLVLLL